MSKPTFEWVYVDPEGEPQKRIRLKRSSRRRAARHELRCRECRVTWRSWAARLLHIGGMSPKTKNRK